MRDSPDEGTAIAGPATTARQRSRHMRINKYIAQAGLASRRGADKLIEDGKVEVNGAVLTEPGYDVGPEDKVTVDGVLISEREKKVYYLLNKPVGYITSAKDEKGRDTVMDLMTDVEERVFPVGRLDYNTSGLLIMTNDGDMSDRIASPRSKTGKTYRVLVAGRIGKPKLDRLSKGIDLGDFVTAPAEIKVVSWTRRSMIVEITIYEGKNRQVRRMFDAIGFPVQELTRIAIGNIKLGHLKPGQYRKMTKGEIAHLLEDR